MSNRTAGILLGITILVTVTVTVWLVTNALHKKTGALEPNPPEASDAIKKDAKQKAVETSNVETQAAIAIYDYVEAMNREDYKAAFSLLDPEYTKQNGITEKNLTDFESGWFPTQMALYMKGVLIKNNQIRCKIILQQVSADAVGDDDLIEYPRDLVLVQDKEGLKIRLSVN